MQPLPSSGVSRAGPVRSLLGFAQSKNTRTFGQGARYFGPKRGKKRRSKEEHLEIYLLKTEPEKHLKEGKGMLCLGIKLGASLPSRLLLLRPRPPLNRDR